MRYDPFTMERWQSTYEHRVRFNLSESGVHPLSVSELLELADRDSDALDVRLGYGQSNGSDELRARIAAMYPDTSQASIVVTTGGAEANFVACWQLMDSEAGTAVTLPNYMQVPGLLDSFATSTSLALQYGVPLPVLVDKFIHTRFDFRHGQNTIHY